jgi:hypothetical protein
MKGCRLVAFRGTGYTEELTIESNRYSPLKLSRCRAIGAIAAVTPMTRGISVAREIVPVESVEKGYDMLHINI